MEVHQNKISQVQLTEMQVTAIGDEAFSYNSYICNWKIPYGVKQIGKRHCKYKRVAQEITIPYSVTSIGDEAFEYCGLLQINILPL